MRSTVTSHASSRGATGRGLGLVLGVTAQLRRTLLVWPLLGLVACVQPRSSDIASVQREFKDLLNPGFELATLSGRDSSDLRLIFSALRQAQSSGRRFDTITRVDFETPQRARVAFTWSGGMHGGFFTLTKKNGVWTITDDAWLV